MPRLLLLTFFCSLVGSLHGARAFAEPVCVTQKNVNLRRGPGPKFPVTWNVPKYMPLEKIEEKKGWARVVDLEGHKHWVHMRSISKKTTCLVVKTKTAKLRKGPGKDQPLADLASVDKYTPFLKLDRDEDWLKIQDAYSGVYWIHETNVWIPMGKLQITF